MTHQERDAVRARRDAAGISGLSDCVTASGRELHRSGYRTGFSTAIFIPHKAPPKEEVIQFPLKAGTDIPALLDALDEAERRIGEYEQGDFFR